MITKSVLAALATSAAILGAPIAAADETSTQTLGSAGTLTNGDVIQHWTISDLKPSSDVIGYPVSGTLWEATATDHAVSGSVLPVVANLLARSASGETYRNLFQVPVAQGVNPGVLAQGEKTSGKVYFDITGATPDRVVYNDGARDLLVWVKAAPAQSSGPGATGPAARPDQSSPTPAASPAGTSTTPPAAGTPATPATGSQGTPITDPAAAANAPTGSQGTPIGENSPSAVPGQAAPTDAPAASPSQSTPGPTSAASPSPAPQDTPTSAPSPSAQPSGTPHGPQPAGSSPTPTPTPVPHGPQS